MISSVNVIKSAVPFPFFVKRPSPLIEPFTKRKPPEIFNIAKEKWIQWSFVL